ncbi:hypothetical protein C8A01DRAFT_46968 [Parachaetomium inaequale]|uniref:Cellobiose dehydrogenase-like cytochrome domain-containing protein n=1 Tax=Parachaetomium inaequale TaxID=2588326 RepID=A0AAN6PG89_9PEZI|nr:hypothetical protein C8A01DRAFT_46968 [Parachaetomium inaequale]
MSLKSLVLLAVGGTQAWTVSAGSSEPTKRQSTTAKYCPGETQVCFSEFTESASDIVYRIAIPDVSAAPFDVLLQIVAPIDKVGWAGVAWDGKMNGNPLTVAWPNGDSAVVSSRWSTQWESGSLDPNGVNSLAWAKNTRAVNSPSSNTSSFGYHDGRGVFDHDLSVAKILKGVFDAVVYGLNNPSPPSTSSSAAVSSAAPHPTTSSRSVTPTRLTALPSSSSKTTPVVVTTRVTQLPKPTSTTVPTRTTTTRRVPDPPASSPTRKPTTPGVVTLTATARPPTTTQERGEWPSWTGGGGPPWARGKGKGRGGRWGRRDGLAVPPAEE